MVEISKEGTLKTQIMYRANLSFTQLNEYLGFLVDKGFVAKTFSDGKEVYVITEKGVNFLQKHAELLRLLNQ